MTVGELRKALESHPDDALVSVNLDPQLTYPGTLVTVLPPGTNQGRCELIAQPDIDSPAYEHPDMEIAAVWAETVRELFARRLASN